MPLEDGLSFILHAIEQEEDSLIFQRWVNGYQHIGFEEFKLQLKPKPQKSEKEILGDVDKILDEFDKRKGRSA